MEITIHDFWTLFTVLQHSEGRSKRGAFGTLPLVLSHTVDSVTDIPLEPAIEPDLGTAVDPIPPEGGEEMVQLLPESNTEDTGPSEQIDLSKRSQNVPTHFLSGIT